MHTALHFILLKKKLATIQEGAVTREVAKPVKPAQEAAADFTGRKILHTGNATPERTRLRRRVLNVRLTFTKSDT